MIKWIFEGKRWFDKVNGNTYHSTVIVNAENNKTIFSSGMNYGYDEGWKRTGFDWLVSKGLMSKDDMHNWEWIRSNFHFSCADVQRKKDLDLERYEGD